MVIDPNSKGLEALLQTLSPDSYYVDVDAARNALRSRGMFNVIDHASGWKIDFIVRKNRAFSRKEFQRRQPITILGVNVHVASPEDTVMAKLEWSHASHGSERQLRDVASILATIGELLD
jgi:hypothetical protein